MPASNPLAQSSQEALKPEGNIHIQFAIKRSQKLMQQPKQTPGRVTPPPKFQPVKGY
jgi:hypothetical protein